jgi:hypothetical protein
MTLPSDYIKLLIYRPDNGADRYLWTLRATADYYGWTQEFEIWSPKTLYEEGGYQFCMNPARQGKESGTAASESGFPGVDPGKGIRQV